MAQVETVQTSNVDLDLHVHPDEVEDFLRNVMAWLLRQCPSVVDPIISVFWPPRNAR